MAALDFIQKHVPYTMNLMGNIPFKKWVDQPKLIDLETQYGFGSAGLPSIHLLAAQYFKNALGFSPCKSDINPWRKTI